MNPSFCSRVNNSQPRVQYMPSFLFILRGVTQFFLLSMSLLSPHHEPSFLQPKLIPETSEDWTTASACCFLVLFSHLPVYDLEHSITLSRHGLHRHNHGLGHQHSLQNYRSYLVHCIRFSSLCSQYGSPACVPGLHLSRKKELTLSRGFGSPLLDSIYSLWYGD